MGIRPPLTRIFIRIFRLARFTHTASIRLSDGKTWEVYIFSSKKRPSILGQATPWGTIIVSEHILSDKPLLNLVILHESRHASLWVEWLPVIIFASEVVGSWIYLGWTNAIVYIVLLILYFWYIELDAEFYTIKNIGLNEYKIITSQDNRKSKLTIKRLLFNVWALFTHLPRPTVVRLYELTHSSSKMSNTNHK